MIKSWLYYLYVSIWGQFIHLNSLPETSSEYKYVHRPQGFYLERAMVGLMYTFIPACEKEHCPQGRRHQVFW